MVTDYDGTIGEDIPAEVNGWVYDPDASWNGDTWRSDTEQVAVVVFDHGTLFDTSLVKIADERVGGMKESICIDGSPTVTDEQSLSPAEARQLAIEWMRSTSPAEWTHPHVCEAVFYSPHGFVLEHYYIESREDIVVYKRERPRDGISAQKIKISGYRGSGNYSVQVVEYGGREEDALEDFSREVEEESLEQAVDLAHVVAARVVTAPAPV